MGKDNDTLSLRDYLAIDRTKLANQRTLLAMLRTGLYLMVMAVTIVSLEFLEELRWVSSILFGAGIITILIGMYLWTNQNKKIKNLYQKK